MNLKSSLFGLVSDSGRLCFIYLAGNTEKERKSILSWSTGTRIYFGEDIGNWSIAVLVKIFMVLQFLLIFLAKDV